jgi:hypothetical protein
VIRLVNISDKNTILCLRTSCQMVDILPACGDNGVGLPGVHAVIARRRAVLGH